MAERSRAPREEMPREHPQRTKLADDLKNFQDFCAMISSRYQFDKNDLDGAVLWQTEATVRINDVLAHLTSLRDEAKDDIKVVDAELDDAIRRHFAKDGAKVTETGITNLIIKDRRHTDALRKHAYLKRDVERAEAMRASYSERGRMIKIMSELYVAGYFADMAGRPRGGSRRPYDDRERDRNR